MTFLMIIAVIALFAVVPALYISNKYIDTSSCKRNWVVILTILSCVAYLSKFDDLAGFFLTLLLSGIFINYAFPFLLNVLRTFTWKSDP